MTQNFRGKNIKDIETASETIINNASFTGKIAHKTNTASNLSVTAQQIADENFDTYIEKRNKAFFGGPSGTRTPDQPVMSRLL